MNPMRPTRWHSKRQEKRIAKAVGGKTTPNSGAGLWSKGFVRGFTRRKKNDKQ